MAGKAEAYIPSLLRRFTQKGWWLKKNTDYSQLIGSKEQGVDYNLALSSLQIEVKNTDKSGALTDRPTPIQVELLDKYGGFVFVVMWDAGYPRLPGGADAYLVPWQDYKEFMQKTSLKRKSIRRHAGPRAWGADEFLSPFVCPWGTGSFEIPPEHPFWDELFRRAEVLDHQIIEIQRWRKQYI